jgi:uncharacterized protein
MSNADILGRFVWHELLTTDTAGAAAFYSKVLPWRTAPSSMPGYTVWMAGQSQIGGLQALPADNGATPPHWLMYVGTPNVDATCAKAQSLGARTVKAPEDIPNVGRFAVLADPQGATFAVFTPGAGPPPGPQPPQGSFSWHELATTDGAAAMRFYAEVFGWRKGPSHHMGDGVGDYQLFEYGGNQVGGIYNLQGAGMPSSWLSYVHVANCDRAVAAAKAAGGRVINGPMEVPGGSWIAVMGDPQGGAFAVHEMPRVSVQPKPASLPPAAKPAAAPKPATAPKPAAATPPKPSVPKTAAAAAAAPKAAAQPAAAPPKTKAKKTAKKAPKKAARKAAKKPVRKAAKKAVRRPAKKAAKKAARKSTARRTRRSAPKKKSARRRR